MIIPREVAESVNNVKIPMEVFEMLHNVSLYLIQDDAHDLGRFTYRDRTDYYYHGHYSPDHPSPHHHWIIGMFGILTAQLGSLAARGMELYNDYKRMEGGDIDKDILDLVEDNNTIALEDYKNEVKAIAPVSNPEKVIKADKRPPLIVPEINDLPGF